MTCCEDQAHKSCIEGSSIMYFVLERVVVASPPCRPFLLSFNHVFRANFSLNGFTFWMASAYGHVGSQSRSLSADAGDKRHQGFTMCFDRWPFRVVSDISTRLLSGEAGKACCQKLFLQEGKRIHARAGDLVPPSPCYTVGGDLHKREYLADNQCRDNQCRLRLISYKSSHQSRGVRILTGNAQGEQ